MSKLLRLALSGPVQTAYLLLLALAAYHYLFQIPRYDYWDVVYIGSFVFDNNELNWKVLFSYLFNPVVESFMVFPKLVILLSNFFGSAVYIIEFGISLIVFFNGYLALIKIYGLPMAPKKNTVLQDLLKLATIFFIYWWPAVLPTYTNSWFSLQYSLAITLGLWAIYYSIDNNWSNRRGLLVLVFWLGSAASHGTGLLLGPVLSVVLFLRRSRRWLSLLILFIALAMLLISNNLYPGKLGSIDDVSVFSISTWKFLIRIITPSFWEMAIFVLLILPGIGLTLYWASRSWQQFLLTASGTIILWGLLVWAATFVARAGDQLHSNPHYLKFFTIVYIAWAVLLIDKLTGSRIEKHGKAWGLIFVISILVWVKGVVDGHGLARAYYSDNQKGYQALRLDKSSFDTDTALLYPNNQLTEKHLPRLLNYQRFPYTELLRK